MVIAQGRVASFVPQDLAGAERIKTLQAARVGSTALT
jgi:hypothetical protein